jgi:hypothetical protein
MELFSEYVVIFALHSIGKTCTIVIQVFINYGIYFLLILVILRNCIHELTLNQKLNATYSDYVFLGQELIWTFYREWNSVS